MPAAPALWLRMLGFELLADLLGSSLEGGISSAFQDGGGQTRFGRTSVVAARLGGLSDLYEPYLLQKEMFGNLNCKHTAGGIEI